MESSPPPLPFKTLPSVYANCLQSCRRAGGLPYLAVRASLARCIAHLMSLSFVSVATLAVLLGTFKSLGSVLKVRVFYKA
jgi:hypothetical protein